MKFETAQFVASALEEREFPKRKLPEIAIAGRSNVGKSSLINLLFQKKTLAKTSSKPGKTRRIQFFLVDDSYYLVDLPGYGYAAASKQEIENWSSAIDAYLNQSESLKLILLLLDIRRTPCKEDLFLVDWANAKNIPVLAIFTKRDKLSDSELNNTLQKHLSFFSKDLTYLCVSTQNNFYRRQVIQKVNEVFR